ncbi:MAG: serine/threonine protein kinase, partial [Pirellulaceae bacterium]|nr:serine/threonine protein kinase [Pirellulaceae bacterium]
MKSHIPASRNILEMPDADHLSRQARLDPICDEFEDAWKQGDTPPVLSEYIHRVRVDDRASLASELLSLDRHYRSARGEAASQEFYLQRLPGFADVIKHAFAPESTSNRTHAELEATIDTSASPTGKQLQPGDYVKYFGDYEIIDEIARGGMGVVYRAKQISLNRIVALKMILSGQIAGEDHIRRFQLEAEAAANLDHPGIVPIYDIGEHDGQHYFSMKLIEGKTLGQIAVELKDDHQRAIELVAKVADAMHHAHQRGILHRDLKPGNVLLDANEQPMVTDFGLARNTQADTGITQTGAIVGTPGFMSPEQAAGSSVTTAADIYSLGAILYQLLCGRPPHQGDTVMKTVLSVINDTPPKPVQINPQIHSDLELVCLKCLEKEPDKRYSSAAEFATDLRAHLVRDPVSVRSPSTLELAKLWLGKNYGNVIWVPIISTVVGVVCGFSMWTFTFGMDMSANVEMYEKFPPSDRPLLAQKWANVSGIAALVFLLLISMIGWATAKLVRTKNRAADIGAGLSVGLLAGLLAFVSGSGAVMLDSMRISDRLDGELIMQLAVVGDKSYTQERIVTQYPTLEGMSDNERAWLLQQKQSADQWSRSVTGIALGALMCLLSYGFCGTVQTWVAGPLIRSKPFALSLFGYLCFTLGLTAIAFVIGGELTMYVLMGSTALFDWTWPILLVLLAIFVMVAVVRNWPWPVQLVGSVLMCCAFGYNIFGNYYDGAPPRVARLRTEIKEATNLVNTAKGRRDFALRLTRAHHFYAAQLKQIGRSELALDSYADAINAIEAGKSPDDFDYEERVLYSQLLFEAGVLAHQVEQPVRAATWLGQHTKLYLSSAETLDRFAKAVVQTNPPKLDYLYDVSATAPDSWWRLAGQLRAIASEMDRQAPAQGPIPDAWLRNVVDQKLDSATDVDEVPDWTARKSRLRRWLTSRQEWELFGPIKLAPEISLEEQFDNPYGPDPGLENPDTNLTPDKVVGSYAGSTVDLIAAFG